MKRKKTGRPATNRQRLVITLPPKMVAKLKRRAQETGRPVGYVVEECVNTSAETEAAAT